jgi:hypothetical protein
MTLPVTITSGAKKLTQVQLHRRLLACDAENQALQAKLAALHAAIPPAAGPHHLGQRQLSGALGVHAR